MSLTFRSIIQMEETLIVGRVEAGLVVLLTADNRLVKIAHRVLIQF